MFSGTFSGTFSRMFSSMFSVAVAFTGLTAQSDPYYGRISTSMEAFGSVFREITTDYVDQTDPQEVITAGIKGMLSTLDPYSVYMRGDESESVDRLSTGTYVGFGFAIARRNGVLTFMSVRPGFAAHSAGIRRGDRLVSVNGIRVDTLPSDSIRPLSRGPVGTTAEFRVVRAGVSDTLTMNLTRMSMPVENVDITTLLDGKVGYLRLAQFSRTSARELRDSLESLLQRGLIESLILDVRGNPGGLLDAATDIASMFLAKGSLIVSTADRNGRRREYRSTAEPIAPSLPLAVLIDDHSASASEILAAAIQDHDRGIVIGKRSYGKGLVQTVVNLPDESSLKMTTSRYYTPSGRCIQIGRRQDPMQKDSGMFVTRRGRLVRSASGVTPDTTITATSLPSPLSTLDSMGVIMDFATERMAAVSELPSGFHVDAKVLTDFYAFAGKQPAERRSALLAELEDVKAKAVRTHLSKGTLSALEQARQSLEREIAADLKRYPQQTALVLEAELLSRFGTEAERDVRLLTIDPTVQTARELLANGGYHAFLGGGSAQDQ